MEGRDRSGNERNRTWLPPLLGGIALVLAGSGSAHAARRVYEPFLYNDGTVLGGVAATGENLTGTYQPFALTPTPEKTLTVESPGLGYGSLGGAPSAVGNRARDKFGGASAAASVDVAQDVITGPGTTIY